MTKSDNIFSKVLLILIPLYFMQGYLFESGGFISTVIVIIWILIDVLYTWEFILKSGKDRIGRVLIVFWILNLFYWIASPKKVPSEFVSSNLSFDTFGVFKNTTLVMLSYFPFKRWVDSQIVGDKYFRLFSVLLIVSAIVGYISFAAVNSMNYDVAVTNNSAYYFIVVLPILGYFFDKKWIYVFLCVITYFLLLCAKRGAILCFIVSMGIFAVQYLKFVPKKKYLTVILMFLVAIVFVAIMAISMYSSNELIQERLQMVKDGYLSDRDSIYGKLWNAFLESSFFRQIFGHGMSQTITIADSYAHNDWLELLTDEGLLGVVVYFFVFKNVFIYYWSNRKQMPAREKYVYLTAALCFFLRSSFSMGYLSPESAMFFIGIAAGQRQTKEKSICQRY